MLFGRFVARDLSPDVFIRTLIRNDATIIPHSRDSLVCFGGGEAVKRRDVIITTRDDAAESFITSISFLYRGTRCRWVPLYRIACDLFMVSKRRFREKWNINVWSVDCPLITMNGKEFLVEKRVLMEQLSTI